MRVLTGWEADQAKQWINAARRAALNSQCNSSKCGSVIVQQFGNEKIISSGFNAPPNGLREGLLFEKPCRCVRKHELNPGFKSLKTGCIHAEQSAIMTALKNPEVLPYCRLYFVRLDEHGSVKASGKPYCTLCSQMTLHSGIPEFTLVHAEGITVYTAEEYNELSFAYAGT